MEESEIPHASSRYRPESEGVKVTLNRHKMEGQPVKYALNWLKELYDHKDSLDMNEIPEFSDKFKHLVSYYKRVGLNLQTEGGDTHKRSLVAPRMLKEEDTKMEMISRKINKIWKKIGQLQGFAEEELNVIDSEFPHNPSLEMLRRLRVKMDADDFIAVIYALESSKEEQEIPAEILARGPNALKVYRAALEEGESDFNMVRVMVMGQENVGKTCLINSLLGKKFNEKHIITEVLAMTRSFMCDEADSTKWTEKEIDHKDEIRDKRESALATKAAKNLQKLVLSSSEYTGEQIEKDSSKRLGISGDRKRKKSNDGASGNEETKRSKTNTSTSTIGETSQATASASPMEGLHANVTKKLVQVMKGKSIKDNSLRIWDYGGQLIYHSIHRFYMTPEGIFVIVFNIADDLDAYAMVIDSSGNKHKHYMTNLEYLLYWIRSAYTYAKDDGRYSDDEIDFPVCIIVATHRNSLTGSEEEICKQVEEKFNRICNAIENQVYKSHVYQKYFAVENELSSSDENIIALKKVILEIKKKMNRPIPHKWVDLLIAIQDSSEEKVTLPLDEVKSMARQCGISDDQTIHVAITYLSDVGEIMYYPTEEALKDIVVIQPMKIVEYVKPVFTIIKADQKVPRLKDDWKKLEKGVLTKCLLKHLWKKIPIFQNDTDEKMFNFFFKLMNKFGLICQKRKQTADSDAIVYYAVSHLHPTIHSLPPEDDQLHDKVSVFHDFCGFLPDHFFQLVLTKFIEEFQVESEHPALAYEHAVLSIDDHHYVRIAVATINHRRMFKTTIVRRRPPNASCVVELIPKTCREVLSFLQSVLETLCKTSARGIQYKMCIPCTCSNNCQQMHVIENFKKHMVFCGSFEIDIKHYCRLFRDPSEALSTSQGEHWSLSEATLLDICKKLNNNWKSLGLHLGLTYAEIEHILVNCHNNNDDAKMEMLIMWMNRQPPEVNKVSVLSDALMKENYVEIAETLEGKSPCTSGFLHGSQLIIISESLGTNWKQFGLRLDMGWNYMKQLESENRWNIIDACIEMLTTWQRKQSVMTNQVDLICQLLETHGLRDVACKLKPVVDAADSLHDRQLFLVSKELGANWKDFGVFLDMRWDYMTKLELQNQGNTLHSCMDMLKKWQKNQTVTTNQVDLMCKKLEKHGFSEVAEKLKQDSTGAVND